MIRIPGWIFGIALILAVGACGAGEPSEEARPATKSPARPAAGGPAAGPTTAPADPSRAEAARPEPTPAAKVPAERLYTVQVGAFVTEDSARAWSQRLSRQGLPVWTTQATVRGRTYHRLRVGASPSLSEARQLGQRISRQYSWPVWIAPVEDNRTVPANAIARTHALVGGS